MFQPTKHSVTLNIVISAVMCVALLLTSGCTTVATQKLVLEEPLTQDTEAKILQETGISGAIIGALVAGAATGGAVFLVAKLNKMQTSDAIALAAIAGSAAAIQGGRIGYAKGKQQGEKIVVTAMQRDQLAKLLRGARQYNARLAQVNESLSEQARKIRHIDDPKIRKKEYSQLTKAGQKEISAADKRIEIRQKAMSNVKWDNRDKPAYNATLETLKRERNQLASSLSKIEQAENRASL